MRKGAQILNLVLVAEVQVLRRSHGVRGQHPETQRYKLGCVAWVFDGTYMRGY